MAAGCLSYLSDGGCAGGILWQVTGRRNRAVPEIRSGSILWGVRGRNMRCPHCGEEMPDYDEEFKFCPSCGMRLKSVSDVLAGNASPVSLEKAGLVSPVSLEKEESVSTESPEEEETASPVSLEKVESESTVSPEEEETASPVSLEKVESESTVSPEQEEAVSPVSLEKEESESTVSPEEEELVSPVSLEKVESESTESPEQEEAVSPVSLEKEESAGTESPEQEEAVSSVSLENEETAAPESLEAAKTEDDLKSFQEEQIRLAAKELELRKAMRAERERQAREERIRLSKVAPEWWETETEVKSEARPESNSAVNPEVRSQAQPETKPGAMPQAKTEAARSGKKLLTKREEEEERQKKRRKSNRRYALITVIVALLTAAAVSFVYLNRNSTQTISVSDGTAVEGGASASDGTAVKGETTVSDGTAVKGGASTSGGTAAEPAAVESTPQNGNTAQESQPAGQAGADPASGAAEPAADPAAGGTQEAVIISYPASFAVSNLGFNNEELGLNDVDNERTDTFVVTDGFFSYEEGEEDTYLFWDDEMAERAFFSASDYEIPEVLIGGDLAMAYCDAVMTGKMTGRYMPSATEFYELDWANRLLVLTSGTGAGHTETVTSGEFIYQENGAISKVVYTYEGSDETDTVEFTYDENDRLIYVGDRDVIYDEDTGKVSRIERDGNVEKEFTYNEAGVLSTETKYFYDEDGEESGSTVFSYTFDESGRLVSLSAENYALMGGTNAYVFTYGEI